VTLVCPACERSHGDDERFCASCGMPLVVEGGPIEAEVTERQARARMVKKQYLDGELVRVAVGRQEAEAQLIQNLLLEQGIPSVVRRSRGFEIPGMLAAGPRDVMVPQSGEAAAREALMQVPQSEQEATPGGSPWPWLAGGIVLGVVPWILVALLA